jgi:hypothetical protein
MNNSDPDSHPIFTVADTAIGQLGGACLADDTAAAAGGVLLQHWREAIRDWGTGGPTAPEVERMIVGDLDDAINALEQLRETIARLAE